MSISLYHGGLNRGFKNATEGKYHIKFICCPFKNMLNNKLPQIIAVDCSHYIVAFGGVYNTKRNGKIKDRFFIITDNGVSTAIKNYRPKVRRVNTANLHYILTQK